MSTQSRIDTLLRLIRNANDSIEEDDKRIAALIAHRNVNRAYKADLEGRVAFLSGVKRSRNPHAAPLARHWNTGYDAERS